MEKAKTVLFWLTTVLLCFELTYGASWDFNLLNKNYVYRMLNHLGYPPYLAAILGVTKLLAFTLILPNGIRRAKEWAYAGTFILFTGGFASHVLAGDSFAQAVFSLVFALVTLVSYLFRPPNRRLVAS